MRWLSFIILIILTSSLVYAIESNMQASVQVLKQDCTKFEKKASFYDADGDLIELGGYGELCNQNGLAFQNGDNIGNIKSTYSSLSITNKGGGNFRTAIYGNIEGNYLTSLKINGDTEFVFSTIQSNYLSSFSMKNNLYGELNINAVVGKASVGNVLGKLNINTNNIDSFSSKGDFSGNINAIVGKFSANNIYDSYIKSVSQISAKENIKNSDIDIAEKLSVKGSLINSEIGSINSDLSSFSATSIDNSYIYAGNLEKFSSSYASYLNLIAVTISSFSVKSEIKNSKVTGFNSYYIKIPGVSKLISETETIGTNLFEVV